MGCIFHVTSNQEMRVTANSGKYLKVQKSKSMKIPKIVKKFIFYVFAQNWKVRFFEIVRKMKISICLIFEKLFFVCFCMFEGCSRDLTTIKNAKHLRKQFGYHFE